MAGRALGWAAAALLWAGVATAQAAWSTYQPPEADFTALFPGAPQAVSQPMGGMAGAVQRSYTLQSGPEAFNVSVFVYPKGTLPAALSQDQLDNLVQLFAQGSGMRVRIAATATVAGRTGVEATLDDPETGAVEIFRVVQLGDRIFMIAYGGEKGTETSPQATRFVSSLRLTGK